MNTKLTTIAVTALAVLTAASAMCTSVTKAEMQTAKNWANAHFKQAGKGALAPFSFVYDGKSSNELLPKWDYSESAKKLSNDRMQLTQTYTEPGTGFEVKCVLVSYNNYPTIEWTVYFKNNGSGNSRVITDVKGLDYIWKSNSFLLHHAVGSPSSPGDYGPIETKFMPGMVKTISAAGGRSTNSDLSYFNLETAPDSGIIIAVGWPGQWTSKWRCGNGVLHVEAGQQYLDTYLLPGEEIRSTMTVMQFWQGEDWIRSQNVWRRWMFAHNAPRPNGKKLTSLLTAASSRQFAEMINANAENQMFFTDKYLERGFKLDYWWMDAGWYYCDGHWPKVGTWEYDKSRFPNGLREVSDNAHKKGVKIVTWFEPERVYSDTWLYENHPEWIIKGDFEGVFGDPDYGNIFNFANKEAREWMTNHVCDFIESQGIDLYRQDFNIDPINYWLHNDTEGRLGMTEQGHCTGILEYWDEIVKRFPYIIIDACASGGRRNDVESMRRAVPLWRTDHPYICTSTQSHTYGISFWIPFSGTGTVGYQNAGYYGLDEGFVPMEAYAVFSNAAPELGIGLDIRRDDLDYENMLRFMDIYQNYVGPAFLGDYYPMTPYSLSEDVWMAWQFDQPEEKKGVVEAFRRPQAKDTSIVLKLRALKADKTYTVTELLTKKIATYTGKQLMEGFRVELDTAPEVAIFAYEIK